MLRLAQAGTAGNRCYPFQGKAGPILDVQVPGMHRQAKRVRTVVDGIHAVSGRMAVAHVCLAHLLCLIICETLHTCDAVETEPV